MNINYIIIKKIIYILNLYKIKFNSNEIKCKMLNNRRFGDYSVHGIYNILLKNNKVNIINNIINKLNKYFIFNKVYYKNFFINFYIDEKILNIKINSIYKFNFFNNKKYTYIFNKNKKNKILIDYSSPNLSKEMHIGHLRSTILGDFMYKMLKFFNFNVIKSNHVGDCGINIGVIITNILNYNIYINNNINITVLENFYIDSIYKYKNCNNFKIRTDYILYMVQNKNNNIINNIWKIITKISIDNNNKIYKLFNISLNNKDLMGESSFIKYIPNIINDLNNKNIIKKINNSNVVIIKKKSTNNKKNIIIQRKNKTFSYISIEISYIRYIFNIIKANKIIYYIDKRQNNHIKYSYIISKKANYIKGSIIHNKFGMVLNKNKKPIKTKDGKTLKIKKLFYKTYKIIKNSFYNKNKFKNINNNKINKILRLISINYIKYNELSKNMYDDYIYELNYFFYNKKNNFLYIQYSYSRLLSILKIYNKNKKHLKKYNIYINNINIFRISLYIIQFENIIIKSYKKYNSNILCNYIYNISLLFSKIYENNKILKEKNINIKNSYIKILIIILNIYKISSKILGIKFIDKI